MGTRPRTSWIICAGQAREVRDGLVTTCPFGRRVAMDDCLTCHLLETLEHERWPRMSCGCEAATPREPATAREISNAQIITNSTGHSRVPA